MFFERCLDVNTDLSTDYCGEIALKFPLGTKADAELVATGVN